MIMVNRQSVLDSPSNIADIKKEAKLTYDLCTRCELLLKLRQYEDWGRFDWAFMCTWANPVDEPFIKLMISLAKHGYHYGAISMHKWWRRLKACNQHNIITYFTYTNFPGPTDKKLFWLELYEHCCRTRETFVQMSEVFRDDRQVEMYLRSLLGISQQRDIKEAWVEWAKRNHPDKGGSVEKFIITKSAYEEWYESNR